jgi:hypothetical protein
METTHTYLTTKQAIEDSKKKDGLIPSEFLATFPNNFGINLCAVKGFDIEKVEDGQLKSITVDFLPTPKKLDEPYFFIVESEDWGENTYIIKSEFDLDDEDVTEFLNNGEPEEDWIHYEIYTKIPVNKLKIFA